MDFVSTMQWQDVATLITPWIPVLVAIITAFFSALFALRSNIRNKAWEKIYEDKRREIREFVQTLDDFGSTVLFGAEIHDLASRPLNDQHTTLWFWARRKGWYPLESTDPVGKTFLALMPGIEELLNNPQTAAPKIEQVRKLLTNVTLEELNEQNERLGRLKTTLALSIWDPDILNQGSKKMADVHAQAYSIKPVFSAIEGEEFAEQWSKDLSPIKLALRKDLNRSGRSLGAATSLSWRWRLRRTRIAKWWSSTRKRLLLSPRGKT